MNFLTQFYREKMGGWKPKVITGLNATPQLIRDVPAKFGGYAFWNPNSSVMYLQLYNASSAGAVTVGTTPVVFRMPIPPTQSANIEFYSGIQGFDAGIVAAVTTTPTGSSPPSSTIEGTFLYL